MSTPENTAYIYTPDGWFVNAGKGRYVRDANDSAFPSPDKLVATGNLVLIGEDEDSGEQYYKYADMKCASSLTGAVRETSSSSIMERVDPLAVEASKAIAKLAELQFDDNVSDEQYTALVDALEPDVRERIGESYARSLVYDPGPKTTAYRPVEHKQNRQDYTGYWYSDHSPVDVDDAERRTSQWMAMKLNNNKPKNRLRGSACYLAGPMTACGDFGESWRKVITPHLEELGVVVLDPTHKPIEIGQEDAAARAEFKKMKETGDLEGLRQILKVIRRVDLRCIDLSSFIIVRLDGTDTVGTWEEIAMAVSQRKPTLIWLDGGLKKKDFNAWLLAQVKLEYVFESMEELLEYLKTIDESDKHPTDHWWMLFDFNDLYKKVIK